MQAGKDWISGHACCRFDVGRSSCTAHYTVRAAFCLVRPSRTSSMHTGKAFANSSVCMPLQEPERLFVLQICGQLVMHLSLNDAWEQGCCSLRGSPSTSTRCSRQAYGTNTSTHPYSSLQTSQQRAAQLCWESCCTRSQKSWDNRVYHSPYLVFSPADRQPHVTRHKACRSKRGQHHDALQPQTDRQLHTEVLEEEMAVTALLQVQMHVQLHQANRLVHHQNFSQWSKPFLAYKLSSS